MRSESTFTLALARRGARWRAVPGACLRQTLTVLITLAALVTPAMPQYNLDDEPLLSSTISDLDIELRGRYVRQWEQDDGTPVLIFNGGFRLDMGHRRMSASNAVVWINPAQSETNGRRYHELTVYLAENAEIAEPGGTVTLDNVLLVRGLRTFGQIIKYQDAHNPREPGTVSALSAGPARPGPDRERPAAAAGGDSGSDPARRCSPSADRPAATRHPLSTAKH